MKILNIEYVSTDHAAVKQRCEVEEERYLIAIFEVLPADHIRGKGDNHSSAESTDRRDQNRNAVGAQNGHRSFEDQLVGFQREIVNQNTVSVMPDVILPGEGGGNQDNERDETDCSLNCRDHICYRIKYF